MAEILQFTPKAESDAVQNNYDFVTLCRDHLTVFGANLDWNAPAWDVSDSIAKRSRSGRLAFVWTNHDTSKTNTNAPLLSTPFLDFARSYMRYQQAMKPTKSFGNRLSALRALERALVDVYGIPNIILSDSSVFDHAQTLIKSKFAEGTAYRIGKELQTISKFINEKCLVPVFFIWNSSLERNNDRNKIGKEFEQERMEKLPDPGSIEALAKAFNIATEPNDVILASVAALLMTAPGRISEVLRLPVDCEVNRKPADGKHTYGLRWWASKGSGPGVKWIGSTMVDVAKEAIAKLIKETKHARSVARWCQENPGSMWLPPESEYLRTQEYSRSKEYTSVLGLSDYVSTNTWMKGNKVPVKKISGKNYVRFSDVEAAVLKKLPKGFPVYDEETGMTYSEALFVVNANLFNPKKGAIPCIFEPVTEQHISDGLGGRTKHNISSLFTRLGFKNEDGSEIDINTHQFRHLLNTISQRGGLSQLDIAKWSGRTDVKQNRDYDHVSGEEMLMIVKENIGTAGMMGPLTEAIEKMPVSREDFIQMKFPTAHVTEFGFCIHDFAMLPCQKHQDCINCTEHVCVKGSAEKTREIRTNLEHVLALIEQAKSEVVDDTYGSDRWLEHHERTAARLQSLIAILEDPSIPEGSVIQLANPDEYNPISNAMGNSKSIEKQEIDILADIQTLMEGES
jgi:hypothetical protein